MTQNERFVKMGPQLLALAAALVRILDAEIDFVKGDQNKANLITLRNQAVVIISETTGETQ